MSGALPPGGRGTLLLLTSRNFAKVHEVFWLKQRQHIHRISRTPSYEAKQDIVFFSFPCLYDAYGFVGNLLLRF